MSTIQSSWATDNLHRIFMSPTYDPKVLNRDEFNLVLRRVQDLCDAMILIAHADIDLCGLGNLRWDAINTDEQHFWVERASLDEGRVSYGPRVADLLESRRRESTLRPRSPFVFGAEPDVTCSQLSGQLTKIAGELGMAWLDFATVQRSACYFFME